MSNVSRVLVKLNPLAEDQKKELDGALSKLKRKIKDTNIFVDYIEHQTYRRPAVRKTDKARKALARKRYEDRMFRRKNRRRTENARFVSENV